MSVAALITDLFFFSKVKGTADAIGVPIQVVRTADALLEACRSGVSLAIVDLNAGGVDPVEAIRQCKTIEPAPRVVAYLSHVQTDLAAAARQAGADAVMPRSQFSAQLPDLLAGKA